MDPSRGPPRDIIILVVDDEPGLRRVACQMLERDGYVTIEAGNGREALDLLDAGGPAIGLILSDIRMPEVDGIELVQRVHQRRPGLPVLLMSGEVTRDWIMRLLREQTLHVIRKPFLHDDLLAMVHQLLEQGGAAGEERA